MEALKPWMRFLPESNREKQQQLKEREQWLMLSPIRQNYLDSNTSFSFFQSFLETKSWVGGMFMQWRASSNQYFGQSYYDLGKESWGWSWKERWVAARPWEKPNSVNTIKKVETKRKTTEITSLPTTKANGKALPLARKSSKVSHE